MIEAIQDRRPSPNTPSAQFAAFVTEIEPRLRRALAGDVGVDRAHDAVADALIYAWEHWPRVSAMTNPAGYLYRVGRSSVRVRRASKVRYLIDETARLPQIEPALPDALRKLPDRQRTVVWLVYACEWSYREVAAALDISASAVGTHATRGLTSLRAQLGNMEANHRG